jgi:hypothetical protein
MPDSAPETRKLWQEAKELNLIFGAVMRTVSSRKAPSEDT